jgi:hypothetical protein
MPVTATTAARLATVFQASGCDFSVSILAARDGESEAADPSLTAHDPPRRRVVTTAQVLSCTSNWMRP